MLKFVKGLGILPRWIIILIDMVILANAVLAAYLLRFNFNLSEMIQVNFQKGTVLFIATGFVAIILTRSYSGIIRYTSLHDGMRIITTTVLGIVLAGIVNFIVLHFNGLNLIPLSVLIIGCFNAVLFLFLYRLCVKYIFSFYARNVYEKINVLIFGAGQLGLITKQIIDQDTASNLKVVGFIEDDPRKSGKIAGGAKIYNSQIITSSFLKNQNIKEVIISIKNLSFERKNEIVDILLRNNIKVRTVPQVDKWVKGELSLKQIKDVNIEDLLGRESIQLNNPAILNELKDKIILITGAAGSIGSELVRQIIQYKPSLLLMLDQAESALYDIQREVELISEKVKMETILADISDAKRVESILKQYRPNIVFHAAAYKHVPMMESNPSEAIFCNIVGTKNLADAAVKYKVEKFVMISTDKAVNPTNIMGCSKRIAEIYVQSLNNYVASSAVNNTSFVTTRFGNVLGSNGSVIPFFKKQISQGGPVTVTHPEITRFFMTISEACQLVLEAASMGKGGEIFIFDMGKSIKILDLAKKMIRLSGLELGRDIEIIFTGLREGEKLYEELLASKENTIPTHHHKIMIAKVPELPYTEISTGVEQLASKAEIVEDELGMVQMMKSLVPEYKSNFSRFEVLDK